MRGSGNTIASYRLLEIEAPSRVPEPIRAETCIYTNVADERFVCELRGRVVIGSACSGHGFKFAPAVGEQLADLAESPHGT